MGDAFATVYRRNWSAVAIETKFTHIRVKTKKSFSPQINTDLSRNLECFGIASHFIV